MSNSFMRIEHARVVNIGQFETGVSNNGPWASFLVLVEYEIDGQEGAKAKARACVNFRGELATWARDNVRPGNPYNQIPDQYLNLLVRPWGDLQQLKRQDGTPFYKASNTLAVEFGDIEQKQDQPAPQHKQANNPDLPF